MAGGGTREAIDDLWALSDLDSEAPNGLELTSDAEILPSVFRVGAAATAATAVATLAAREVLRLRTGTGPTVAVDGRHASLAFRSERYLTVDGEAPASPWSALSGYYRTADDGWIQLHCNFDHHAAGVVSELGSEPTRDAVAAAILGRGRFELEDALAAGGMCAATFRSPIEWAEHPQSKAIGALPLLEIVKIGDADPRPLPSGGHRALDSIRVLDQTRIIAGPVCGRFLASHGATVMRVGAQHLPVIESILADTGMGKVAVDLDLRAGADRARFEALVSTADVVVQGYRPGGLEAMGFGAEDVADCCPGVVYASLSAYGHEGPWANRRGFDSLVQTASGIGWEGMVAADAEGPRPLPAQALDHASGYLLAYGVAVALHRRATVGGSWLVRGSLAQTANWLTGLGRIDGLGIPEPEPPRDLIVHCEGDFGRVGVIGPVGSISGASPRWDRCAPRLGSSGPRWPERD